MANPNPTNLTNDQRRSGLARKGIVDEVGSRSFRSEVWSVINAMLRDAEAGVYEFPTTYAGIAEELNVRGFRVRKGDLFDDKKVENVLVALGINRPQVRRWIAEAKAIAFDMNVEPTHMVEQAKQIWLAHDHQWDVEGNPYDDGPPEFTNRKFMPTFVHPDDFVLPFGKPLGPYTPRASRFYRLYGSFEAAEEYVRGHEVNGGAPMRVVKSFLERADAAWVHEVPGDPSSAKVGVKLHWSIWDTAPLQALAQYHRDLADAEAKKAEKGARKTSEEG